MVVLVTLIVTVLPPVPLNDSLALWPGAVVVTVTGGPSIAIVPVMSAGALLICKVSPPT